MCSKPQQVSVPHQGGGDVFVEYQPWQCSRSLLPWWHPCRKSTSHHKCKGWHILHTGKDQMLHIKNFQHEVYYIDYPILVDCTWYWCWMFSVGGQCGGAGCGHPGYIQWPGCVQVGQLLGPGQGGLCWQGEELGAEDGLGGHGGQWLYLYWEARITEQVHVWSDQYL